MVVLFPFSLHIAVPTASIYTSVPLLGRRGRKDLTHSFDYGDDDLDPQWKSPEDTELKDMEEFITLDRQQRQLKHAEEKEWVATELGSVQSEGVFLSPALFIIGAILFCINYVT